MNYKLLSISALLSIFTVHNAVAMEKMKIVMRFDASDKLNTGIEYSVEQKKAIDQFHAAALKVKTEIHSVNIKGTFAIAYGSALKPSWFSDVFPMDIAIVERTGNSEGDLISKVVFTAENIEQLRSLQMFYAREKIALEKKIEYEKPESKTRLFFTAIASSVVTPMFYYLFRKSPYLIPQKNVASYFGISLVGIAGVCGFVYGVTKMSQFLNYTKYKQEQDKKVHDAKIKLMNYTMEFLNRLNEGFGMLREAEDTPTSDASLKGKQAIIQLKDGEENKIHTPLYTTESDE
jgi:hypothetical protein